MRRRQLLTATAIGIAGIAGCSSDSGGDGTEASTGTPTETSMGTATESMGNDVDEGLATPEATVQTFIDTLYGNDDIEGANALYHPESEAPELSEEDFEQYGGLSAMGAELQSTEVVSESDTQTEVHADIEYSSPAGTAVQTDWFTLAPSDSEWLVLSWIPEAVRNQGTPTPTPSN